MCHFILQNSKISCHHKFNSYYHKNKLCHFILENSKILVMITNNIIYKYIWLGLNKFLLKIMKILIKNKNKMYNITPQFSSVELLNKYRDEDQIINKKIEIDEKLDKQNENLSKAIDKNLSKYLE